MKKLSLFFCKLGSCKWLSPREGGSEGSSAEKLRKAEKLWATILSVVGHGRTKTISKEPVFLGRLFSSPLYIFHWLSTKRGQEHILSQRPLNTVPRECWTTHARTQRQLNCPNSGWGRNKSELSTSALRWNRSYRESKTALDCLSKERMAYGEEEKNKSRVFSSEWWQFEGQVLQMSPLILLFYQHLLSITCEAKCWEKTNCSTWTLFQS